MSGGGSEDPNVFNPEVFSARRITVAPTVVLIGFCRGYGGYFQKTKSSITLYPFEYTRSNNPRSNSRAY